MLLGVFTVAPVTLFLNAFFLSTHLPTHFDLGLLLPTE